MTEQKKVRPISDLDQLNVTNYYYETSPMVCSNAMLFDISSGRLTNLRVQSGCNGNLQG
ncbi:TSCPD domain-containing protein, partial [Eubacterium pyruvativorans]